MELETVIKWFEKDTVEFDDGRVYVFPHGAQFVKEWCKAQLPDKPKPLGFVHHSCPDCNERLSLEGGLYATVYDKCYKCGRNVGAKE
jgi:hypothetical protein